MAFIYLEKPKEIDLPQLSEQLGCGVNVGTDMQGQYVSADVDEETLTEKVKAHKPNKTQAKAREAEAATKAEAEAKGRADKEAALQKKLGLTEDEFALLKSL